MPENLGQQDTWAKSLKQKKNKTRRQKQNNLPINLGNKTTPLSASAGKKNAPKSPEATSEKGINVKKQLAIARRLRRKEKGARKEGKITSKIEEKEAAMLTASLLNKAWLSAVGSYGLSLIYVGFHAIMAHLFKSKYFCLLGTEWYKCNKRKYNMFTFLWGMLEITLLAIIFILVILIVIAIFYLIYQQFKWQIEVAGTMLEFWNRMNSL